MRKKTAKNLAGIKGRSKLPNDLYRWMVKAENKFGDKIAKLDLEYVEPERSEGGTLRAIYYSNNDGHWKILDIGMVDFPVELADNLFENKALSKADYLIKMIEDQSKIRNMLNTIYEEDEKQEITPELDRSVKLAFAKIVRRILPDEQEEISYKDNKYSIRIKKIEYFTPGSDEDYPELNQHDHNTIRDIAVNELKSFGINYKRLIINSIENYWIILEVYLQGDSLEDEKIEFTLDQLEDQVASIVCSILITIRDNGYSIEDIIDSEEDIERYAYSYAREYIKEMTNTKDNTTLQ